MFREENQTNDMIRKIDERKEFILKFIDLRAALDTVGKRNIWKYLKELKVPTKLIDDTKSTYEPVKEKVQLIGKNLLEFRIYD